MMSLSIDLSDGRDRLGAVKKQALSTCCNRRWAGLIEICALCSVIRQTVFSVYPPYSPAIRPFFHGQITPRMGTVSPSIVWYVMWTRDGDLDNEGYFQPNHFVPLIEFTQNEGPATYAEAVKCGKTLRRPILSSKNSVSSRQNVSGNVKKRPITSFRGRQDTGDKEIQSLVYHQSPLLYPYERIILICRNRETRENSGWFHCVII